ncbi:MAG: nucleotidyltransferase family protein [Candidatus Methanoperedens sp.]
MKTLEEIKTTLTKHKEKLKQNYNVKKIGIFGSYARGEQKEISDVDVLVEFEEPVGFAFIHLADSLEELLGVKVDLTTKDAIKPNRWKYIKDDLVYV